MSEVMLFVDCLIGEKHYELLKFYRDYKALTPQEQQHQGFGLTWIGHQAKKIFGLTTLIRFRQVNGSDANARFYELLNSFYTKSTKKKQT